MAYQSLFSSGSQLLVYLFVSGTLTGLLTSSLSDKNFIR